MSWLPYLAWRQSSSQQSRFDPQPQLITFIPLAQFIAVAASRQEHRNPAQTFNFQEQYDSCHKFTHLCIAVLLDMHVHLMVWHVRSCFPVPMQEFMPIMHSQLATPATVIAKSAQVTTGPLQPYCAGNAVCLPCLQALSDAYTMYSLHL